MWHTDSKMTPNDSCLLVWTLLCNLPTSVGRSCDLFLTNGICQRGCAITSTIRLQKIVTFVLLADCLPCWLWWNNSSCWGGSRGIELRISTGQQPDRNWGPQFNVPKELNLTNDYVQETRSRSFPSQAFRWDLSLSQHLDCSHMRDLEAEAPLSHALTHRKRDIVFIVLSH